MTTTPQAIHTIRPIPTDPAPSSTPLGEMKIPDPAKITLHIYTINIIGLYTEKIKTNTMQSHFPMHVSSYNYVFSYIYIYTCIINNYYFCHACLHWCLKVKVIRTERDLHYLIGPRQLVGCFTNQLWCSKACSEILEYSMQEQNHLKVRLTHQNSNISIFNLVTAS